MITKKRYLIPAFLLSFALALTMISGAISFVAPSTTGDSVNGTTYNFSVNVALADNYTDCNWSTTTDAVFGATLNTSINQLTFHNVSDTTALTETEDTTLTVNCSNYYSNQSETATLTINVDNTDPVCTSDLNIGEDTIPYMDAFGIYPSDSSTDTTDITWAWTLFDPSGNSQQTSTSQTPNFAGDDFDEIGTFILGLSVTDEVSRVTACTNLTIDVTGTDDAIPGGTIITILKENKIALYIGIGVIFLLVIGVAGYFIIQGSKK